MADQFFELKMKTYFKRIDFDGDGSITRADFEGMGKRLTALEKVGAEKGKVIQEKLNAVFDKYVSIVGGGSDAPINQAAFIAGMNKLVHSEADKEVLRGPLPLFFEAVDADCDGQISEDEYAVFFDVIGVDKSLAAASFKAIDVDNDNKLSLEEFVTAGLNFFCDKKIDCPSQNFWGPLVTEPFFERKMRTYFKRIDFDGDGAITRADFEGMGKRFVSLEKVGAEKGKVIQEKLNAVFDKYVAIVGGGSDAPINQAAFIAGMNSLVHSAADVEILKGPLPLFFEAVDADCDGQISEPEYAVFFEAIGVDKALAPASFKAIDVDNDNKLSLDEFVTAGLAFFCDKKEDCPSQNFWGPLEK